MRPQRIEGQAQPGLRWGPFTARIPLYHTRIEWPEFSQGIVVAGATGLGLIPLMTTYLGFSFEVAIAAICIHTLLLSSSPILFGEPYAPGWITPALPLVMLYLFSANSPYDDPTERIQAMTALSLDFALLVAILGLTGLGHRFIVWLPPALKGGIILGAAVAALKRVFLDDYDRFLSVQPVSTILAVSVCMILTFSAPIQRLKLKYGWLRVIAGLGLLPGFLLAAAVGPFMLRPDGTPEIVYNIEWGYLIPPFGELFNQVSPFVIGWPSLEMFIGGIPLALMGYTILFGDVVTGMEVLKASIHKRPDEKIVMDVDRLHYSVAVRNVLMALFAPFFPSQGCLWTGVHVIIVQRWSEGRQYMDSLYSGIASYYVFGLPILYVFLPIVTGLKPLMGIALSLTLTLTGFACAYVAMGIPKSNTERGAALLTAVALAIFSPWIGMTVGVLATLTLCGLSAAEEPPCEPVPVEE